MFTTVPIQTVPIKCPFYLPVVETSPIRSFSFGTSENSNMSSIDI